MKYRTDVSLENRNSSQAALARSVVDGFPTPARVLDVGCAAGDLGAALVGRGYEVVGVEGDEELAAVASPRLTEVAVADIDGAPLGDVVSGPFDAILFGDVLEHLLRPERVLASAVPLLSERGCVVASIPNIAHGSVRLALLQGRWKYTNEGLLDRTHLRFFTLDSIVDLFAGAGLTIDDVQATVLDPLAAGVEIDDESLPGDIVEWVRDQDGAYDFQYIVRAHHTAPEDGEVRRDHEVRRLIPLPRPDDAHTQRRRDIERARTVATAKADQLAQLEDERAAILVVKDYAVGQEAELGRLRYQVRAQADDLHQVRTELIETHRHLAEAIADDQAAHARLREVTESLQARAFVRRAVRKVATKAGLR